MVNLILVISNLFTICECGSNLGYLPKLLFLDHIIFFITWGFGWKGPLNDFHIQVLEGVIKYRWNALPVEQRDGMKNYISEVIVKVTESAPPDYGLEVNCCLKSIWTYILTYWFFVSFQVMKSRSVGRGFMSIN